MLKQPCAELGCRELTTLPRCPFHTRERDRARQARRGDRYGGDYPRRRAALLATAEVCFWCGQPPRPNDPLTADHYGDGLVPAHRSCNSARANRARGSRAAKP